MNSQLAYEIGAVFLLAALLMFGTAQGSVGKLKFGSGTMLALGAAVLGFGLYHYSGQILAMIPSGESTEHAGTSTAASIPPTSQPKGSSSPVKHRAAAQPSTPVEKIIVVEEVPAAENVDAPAAPQTKKSTTATPQAQPAPDPCEQSAYESKARRALKSMGCGLHIIRKKNAQP